MTIKDQGTIEGATKAIEFLAGGLNLTNSGEILGTVYSPGSGGAATITNSGFMTKIDVSNASDTVKNTGVIDGDVATRWRTDTYRGTPEFAGFKPGVGLILAAPSPVSAVALNLQAGLEGWTGRVYTAPGANPPADLEGWTPVSAPFISRTVPMDIPLTAQPSRLYLIWITRLAPTDAGFAASVAEAQLRTAQ